MCYAILLLCLVSTAMCYTGGPPVDTHPTLCTDMRPTGHNHGTSLALDIATPPYTITTTDSGYTAGGSTMVTISGTGGSRFVGFFIQARRADPSLDNDEAIGQFSSEPVETQLLTCHNNTNSAWAQSNKTALSSVSATWEAPTQDEGPIQFKAVIIKGEPNRGYFYPHVKSAQLSYMAGDPVPNDATAQPITTSSGPTHVISLTLVPVAVMLAEVVPMTFD